MTVKADVRVQCTWLWCFPVCYSYDIAWQWRLTVVYIIKCTGGGGAGEGGCQGPAPLYWFQGPFHPCWIENWVVVIIPIRWVHVFWKMHVPVLFIISQSVYYFTKCVYPCCSRVNVLWGWAMHEHVLFIISQSVCIPCCVRVHALWVLAMHVHVLFISFCKVCDHYRGRIHVFELWQFIYICSWCVYRFFMLHSVCVCLILT